MLFSHSLTSPPALPLRPARHPHSLVPTAVPHLNGLCSCTPPLGVLSPPFLAQILPPLRCHLPSGSSTHATSSVPPNPCTGHAPSPFRVAQLVATHPSWPLGMVHSAVLQVPSVIALCLPCPVTSSWAGSLPDPSLYEKQAVLVTMGEVREIRYRPF